MKNKREMRKLALQAERIREFTTQDLRAVVGGFLTDACRLSGTCNGTASCCTASYSCGAGGAGTTHSV